MSQKVFCNTKNLTRLSYTLTEDMPQFFGSRLYGIFLSFWLIDQITITFGRIHEVINNGKMRHGYFSAPKVKILLLVILTSLIRFEVPCTRFEQNFTLLTNQISNPKIIKI